MTISKHLYLVHGIHSKERLNQDLCCKEHTASVSFEDLMTANPAHQRDPLEFGWKDKDSCYIPDWFSGPPYPNNLFTVAEDPPAENESGDQIEDTAIEQSLMNWMIQVLKQFGMMTLTII